MIFNLDQMNGYRDEVKEAMNRVVDSGQFIYGPEVKKFEEEFAAYTRQTHTVGVGSGTDAIRIALLALGVKPGDEVISPAFNVAYTALAVHAIGATNVFVDCDPDSLLMDLDKVPAAITDKTRVLLPVHLYGRMVDMPRACNIARDHNLMLVEDAAQAHGSLSDALYPGEYSDAAAYSFYPTKNLGALGEGGAITTNIDVVAERARLLRDGGRTDRYLHVLPGLNSGLDELQAAILRVKLRHLRHSNIRRMMLATIYREELRGIPDIRVVSPYGYSGHTYHLFVIRAQGRDALHSFLKEKGIPTLVHYPVIVPEQPCFKAALPGGPWPEAELAAREVLSLPMHPDLTLAEIKQVANAIKEFYL